MTQKNAKGAGAIRLAPLAEVTPAELSLTLNDFEISRWLTRVPYPYTLADAETFIEHFGHDPDVRAVFAPEGFAGMVGLDPDLGYWLGRQFWRRGYAFAASRKMLARHFISREAEGVTSGHFDGNTRSARVLERLGFCYTQDKLVTPLSTEQPVTLKEMHLNSERFWAGLAMPLRTPRLLLRPMMFEDADRLLQIVTQEDVARMLFLFHAGWSKPEAQEFIQNWAYAGTLGFRLAITDTAGRFLGSIGVGAGDIPQIFYFLDPKEAGKGYASEVVQAFCQFLFQRFGLEALAADVFDDNPASARVLEKSGFRAVGKAMGTSKARLEPAPVVLYRLEKLG